MSQKAPLLQIRKSYFIAYSLLATGIGITQAAAYSMGLLVPAYAYPTVGSGPAFWSQLNSAADSGVSVTAIFNPSNGPGTAKDDNYAKAVDALTKKANGHAIGYVHTRVDPASLALRDLATVEAEVDSYALWYGDSGVSGIFVDEMRSDASSSAGGADSSDPSATVAKYYQDLYLYITQNHPSYRVVGNPGTSGGEVETYIKSPRSVDTLITFEDVSGYDSATPPAWTANYSAGNFANIPYNVPGASLDYFVRLARVRNVEYIYITDDYHSDSPSGQVVNPWDDIATYLTKEIEIVKSINDSTLPTEVFFSRAQGQAASLFVSGISGTYQIQVSSDLVNWTTAFTTTTATGGFIWTDPDSSSPVRKFYRAVLSN